MHKGSGFSTSSSTFVILNFFYNTHSKWVWYLLVACHTPLTISDLEHLFVCLNRPFVCLGKICPSPLLIFNYLFCWWVVGICSYSGYQSCIAVWYAGVCSPLHGLTFYTPNSVLWCIVWGYRILKSFCFFFSSSISSQHDVAEFKMHVLVLTLIATKAASLPSFMWYEKESFFISAKLGSQIKRFCSSSFGVPCFSLWNASWIQARS